MVAPVHGLGKLVAHPGAPYQLPDLETASGEELYQASCANCHGPDGTGLPDALLAFEEELPDFTDCDFAVREPDADWIAVAHEGGPVRGFSEMMPAFRGALTEEQIGRVISYIRTMCTDARWPAGELNLPRLLVTEKAYPEDEWVIEADAASDGDAATAAFVYEWRFGPQSQVEFVLPYGWGRMPTAPTGRGGGGNATSGGLVHGLGDIALGVKHAAFHDGDAGTILSFMGEVILGTGDQGAGPGSGRTWIEGFMSFGQLLPGDGFLQAQLGAKTPIVGDTDDHISTELFAQGALGMTWSRTPWGRAWSPAIEVLVKRATLDGSDTRIDLVPQVQVALNTRQHVLANFGIAIPTTARAGRSPRFLAYVLLDWFDGGFFEGW